MTAYLTSCEAASAADLLAADNRHVDNTRNRRPYEPLLAYEVDGVWRPETLNEVDL